MKGNWQCPKCQSLRVGFLEHVPDLSERDAAGARSQSAPRRVLIAPRTEKGLLRSTTRDELIGETEAFLCADCGYLEEYVKDPSRVPWDELVGFGWCRPEPPPQGPHR